MAFNLLVILGSVLLLWFATIIHKKQRYFKDRNVPHDSPIFPLGNFWKVGLTMHFIEKINSLYDKFKGSDVMCGFYIFTKPVYLITDLELLKNILVKDFYSFHDRGLYHVRLPTITKRAFKSN